MDRLEHDLRQLLGSDRWALPYDAGLVSRARDGAARRRRARGAGAIAGLAVVATAAVLVTVSALGPAPDRVPPPSRESLPDPPLIVVDGDVLLTCGIGPRFPASALDRGASGPADQGEVTAALDDLRATAGIDAPAELRKSPASAARWMVLGDDPSASPRELLVALGNWDVYGDPNPAVREYVTLERTENGWRANRWGSYCDLRPALRNPISWAVVTGVPGGLDPNSSTVTVEVMEIECTSGRDPSPFLHEPVIVETADTVTVYWTSTRGGETCPGNPSVRRTLQLDQPIGDRVLRDGSHWPPRPVTGF